VRSGFSDEDYIPFFIWQNTSQQRAPRRRPTAPGINEDNIIGPMNTTGRLTRAKATSMSQERTNRTTEQTADMEVKEVINKAAVRGKQWGDDSWYVESEKRCGCTSLSKPFRDVSGIHREVGMAQRWKEMDGCLKST
jgi:hypothetical protein